jgi:type II secretory pathway pseudopilin PulG
MKRPPPAPGFTLIELLVLIVVFAGSVVALLSVAIEAAKRVGDNKDYALAAQLAQEQAEMVIAVRRAGYGFVAGTSSPTAVPGYTGFSYSVVKTACTVTNQICNCTSAQTDQTTLWSLPNGCAMIDVVINRGGTSPALASITLLLAAYN